METGVQWNGDAEGWCYPLFPGKGCTVHLPVVLGLNSR